MHRIVCLTLLACLGVAADVAAAPRIELVEFRIEPTSFALGESFTIHARAKATGVRLGSFILRTAEAVDEDRAIPGFPVYNGGKYYLADKKDYFLKDNGPLDGDPQDGSFRLRVSTRGWKPGRFTFAFFASCRPEPGPLVVARHDFAVVVEEGKVRIEDLGKNANDVSRVIEEFQVSSFEIRPGEPIKIAARTTPIQGVSFELITPYYVSADRALPGFQYDVEGKKARLPSATPQFELSTKGWHPGVHHLAFNVLDNRRNIRDFRNFAVKVIGPGDRLTVRVEDSWRFAPGTHFNRFLPLRDGTLLCLDQQSSDGGRTWQRGTGGFGNGGQQLRDGRVLGLEYSCLPVEGQDGWYSVERSLCEGAKVRFGKSMARVHVPEAAPARGHSLHRGPLFMRSIVECADGSLVALMAGWFKSDTALCPYGKGRPYSRGYVCRSTDEGRTWQYLTTLGYEQIGSEGYNEGSMRRLPNGEILAVVRTGNATDLHCQDNPIMWSVSRDDGRTWSKPERTGVDGAFPSLAVLSDGQVAMSYGRPGAMLIFSADHGRTWTDPTCIDATPYSGYTDVVEIGPGLLLMGYGAKGYFDPVTKERDNQLRLARVRYEAASKASP
jgi:hypothetical protein